MTQTLPTLNLRLVNHRALRRCELTSLSKVNVICGANNSGKTTILETITKENNFSEGWTFSGKETASLLGEYMQRSGSPLISVNGNSSTLNNFFSRATSISAALSAAITQPVIFESDADEIAGRFFLEAEKYHQKSKGNAGYSWNLTSFYNDKPFFDETLAALKIVFRQVFEQLRPRVIETDQTVLITPKRRIASTGPIEGLSVGPDGQGLIDHLFLLKSNLPATRERKFFERFWSAFQEVTGNLKFDISLHAGTKNLRLYFSEVGNEDWRFADDCGLGLRELMLIIYFSLEETQSLVLIEEPENHLHPEMQRRLLWFLKEKTPPTKRFILSTHSSVFLDSSSVDRIFRCALRNGEIHVEDDTKKAILLNDLGYSVADNLVSDLVIVVEGSSDKILLTELLSRMGLMGKYNIKFWILNGDNMANADLEGFADRFSILVLLDNDPDSESARKPFLAACRKLNISVTRTKRYSIENYIPLRVFRESFNDLIPSRLSELKESIPIWAQTGSKIKKGNIKKGMRTFAPKVTLEDISGTDLEQFLRRVKSHLEA